MYALATLLIANVLDILSGLIGALETHTLSSKAMKHGMVSKTYIWIMVGVGYLIKYGCTEYINIDFDPVPLVISYYVIMEIVSIIENVSVYLPIPTKLKNLFDKFDENGHVKNEDTESTTVETQSTDKPNLIVEFKGDNNE